MSYKGIEITSQEDYIFSDTKPYNPEFDLEELKIIQAKLENFTSGRSCDGITSQEAETFLDWVTFNARTYAVRNIPESAMSASMAGQCAPTQRINYKLLSKIGLDVRAFNTADCIGQIPINNEDFKRIQNGWSSPAVRHSVSLVNIPIIDNDGDTQLYKFLLDPTFRQFCRKENCEYSNFFNEEYLRTGTVAPHPGYFLEANNLEHLGKTQEVAQKSEWLGKYIISKGYFYLDEENAKLYGDAFARASTRIEFQNIPIQMTGNDYIRNFENIPMQIFETDRDDSKYTMLPSEMKGQKQGIFSKIVDFFRNKIGGKKPLALNEGNSSSINRKTNSNSEIEGVTLSEEELEAYREGEQAVLEAYRNNEWNNRDGEDINKTYTGR